jgi:hypothetical protein
MLRASFASAALFLGAADAVAGDDAFLATPIRSTPGAYIPRGSTLNAPVITPVGTKHGETLFEVTPMGHDAGTFLTRSLDSGLVATRECTGWFTLDYLYWATRGVDTPPLVTTGPVPFGPAGTALAGEAVFGGNTQLNGMRPGFRLSAGAFIDSANQWALSHEIISLGSRSERIAGGSNGTNVVLLPQPFSVGGTPFPNVIPIGFPGAAGTVTASNQTSFFSGDTHLRRVYQDGTGNRFDLLAGYRFLQLGDSLSESFDTVSTGPAFFSSARLMGEQSVRTRNYFHGGEVGFQYQHRRGAFAFEMQSTIAIGSTYSEVDRSFTRAAFVGPPAQPLTLPIAQTGSEVTHTDFAFVPQVGFKLGWQPTDHVRLTAGYDFLYWSRVRRAAHLWDGTDSTTSFWAQGVSAGVEVRY